MLLLKERAYKSLFGFRPLRAPMFAKAAKPLRLFSLKRLVPIRGHKAFGLKGVVGFLTLLGCETLMV